jgi:hypothetical protein
MALVLNEWEEEMAGRRRDFERRPPEEEMKLLTVREEAAIAIEKRRLGFVCLREIYI